MGACTFAMEARTCAMEAHLERRLHGLMRYPPKYMGLLLEGLNGNVQNHCSNTICGKVPSHVEGAYLENFR